MGHVKRTDLDMSGLWKGEDVLTCAAFRISKNRVTIHQHPICCVIGLLAKQAAGHQILTICRPHLPLRLYHYAILLFHVR